MFNQFPANVWTKPHERSCGDQEHVEVFLMFRYSQTYLNFKMVKAEDKYQEFALLIFIDSCWTCVLGMF